MIDYPDPYRLYDSASSLPTIYVSSIMIYSDTVVFHREVSIHREYATSSHSMERCIHPLVIEKHTDALYHPRHTLDGYRSISLII